MQEWFLLKKIYQYQYWYFISLHCGPSIVQEDHCTLEVTWHFNSWFSYFRITSPKKVLTSKVKLVSGGSNKGIRSIFNNRVTSKMRRPFYRSKLGIKYPRPSKKSLLEFIRNIPMFVKWPVLKNVGMYFYIGSKILKVLKNQWPDHRTKRYLYYLNSMYLVPKYLSYLHKYLVDKCLQI